MNVVIEKIGVKTSGDRQGKLRRRKYWLKMIGVWEGWQVVLGH